MYASTSGATIVINDKNEVVNDLQSRSVVEDVECALNINTCVPSAKWQLHIA